MLRISGTSEESAAWLQLFQNKHINIEYGSESLLQYKELSSHCPEATLRYSKASVIAVDLVLSSEIVLSGEFLLGNISQNSCNRIKYHYKDH